MPVCPVDLTNLDNITSAAKTVADELNRRRIKGLYALVNNAGGGLLIRIPEKVILAFFKTEYNFLFLKYSCFTLPRFRILSSG
jgi:NAD(P)-dependent dehydrogenase (short-subunit alcohol dehydrogenase family)